MEYFTERRERLGIAFSQFLAYLRTGSLRTTIPIGTLTGETFEREVLKPFEQIFSCGKRNRAMLTYLSHDLVGGNSSSIDALALIPEILHKGSIVIDDIQDRTMQRYERPTAHAAMGIPLAVNIGTLAYFLPLHCLEMASVAKEVREGVIEAYHRTVVGAIIGQQVGLAWRERRYRDHELPTEAEYLNMLARKTGTQLVFATAVGAIGGGATSEQRQDLKLLALHAGVAYQLRDDALDLVEEHTDALNDLKQGEITLAEIWMKEHDPAQWEQLRRSFADMAEDAGAAERVRNMLAGSGSLGYVQERMDAHIALAQERLMRFAPSPERDRFADVLSQLVTWK